jgi:hypothetical protein
MARTLQCYVNYIAAVRRVGCAAGVSGRPEVEMEFLNRGYCDSVPGSGMELPGANCIHNNIFHAISKRPQNL